MLCTFFVYVHFSSAFNFVNGDPIRKIQSFCCLFKTFIPLKMFQTFRRAKRPFYKHAWITNWNQILIKKKISRKDHRSFNIISKKYSSKNISRSEKFASSSRVTSILPSYTCPANWTTLVSPRETKNSLESKNSWTKRSKQFRSHEKESHPPQAKISSFLLTRSNLRFRSIFSSFFFFFSSFPCSCCASQRRSFHISRVPTRHGQLFELSTTLKARAKHTRGGRGSIFEPFLRRRCFSFASPGGTPRMGMLETEIENSSDARQGNPWNSSVWLCLEYFCSKDVNLDLIFLKLSKNSWNVSHRTIFRLFVEKRKRKYVLKCQENYYWKQRIIHKENLSLRIINRTRNSSWRISNVFFPFSLFWCANVEPSPSLRATCSSINRGASQGQSSLLFFFNY